MPDIDLTSLSQAQEDALGDLVHDVARQAASNAVNAGEGVEFLLSNGRTEEQIVERLAELTAEEG